MKKILWTVLAFVAVFPSKVALAQDPGAPNEEAGSALERLAERDEAETEDDGAWQTLDTYRRHPLNLNQAGAGDLAALGLLTPQQIGWFLSYRTGFGKLISIHELQAVPGWDLATIRRLLPFVFVGRDESLYEAVRARWTGGDHAGLARIGRTLERPRGFLTGRDSLRPYAGGPENIFLRYGYDFKNLMQYGFVADKDAGEALFGKREPAGFDFYSGHFFLRHAGVLEALALGDYTVNFGQGLLQWQSLAFAGGADLAASIRQGPVLRPYRSAGEYNFRRGAAITLQKSGWAITAFGSVRRIGTHPDVSPDGKPVFTSIRTDGYHRTASELAEKSNTGETGWGIRLSRTAANWQVGVNTVFTGFSRFMLKSSGPYNATAFRGRGLQGYSIDVAARFSRGEWFGEMAVDDHGHTAVLAGLLGSVSPKLDLTCVARSLAPGYASFFADAFTQNAAPANETGWYTAFAFRPLAGLTVTFSADFFRFPYMKYRVDAPSAGHEYFLLAQYRRGKVLAWTARFSVQAKALNEATGGPGLRAIGPITKMSLRAGLSATVSRRASWIWRIEGNRVRREAAAAEYGLLATAEYSFRTRGFAGNAGLDYFNTGGYDSRIYSYEPGVLFAYAMPAWYGRGLHYWLNFSRKFTLHRGLSGSKTDLDVWCKWQQSLYPGQNSVGSGYEEIRGDHKSALTLQVRITW